MRPSLYLCGIEAALAVIGGKWKPIVLYHLAPQARRFGELRRMVAGISEKMLIQQLREMEADGVVARRDFHEVPPRVEYSLTPFGVSLSHALRPLCEWGGEHMARIEGDEEPGRWLPGSGPGRARWRARVTGPGRVGGRPSLRRRLFVTGDRLRLAPCDTEGLPG